MDKGLKILLDYYWQSGGWKAKPTISAEDFAIAKNEGYMFENAVQNISHAETLERLSTVLKKITPSDVANAFLYSLSTRRLEYRSALGSYWYAIAIPEHEQINRSSVLGNDYCTLCNWFKRIDKNTENFMRYKFGGYNQTHASFALFDLEQFLTLPSVTPTKRDKEILMRILDCVNALSDRDKAGKLLDRIIKERIYKTNKQETRILLGILGICGILSSNEFPCYYDKFVDEFARDPIEHQNDFYYPVNRWKKADGINEESFRRVFGCVKDLTVSAF